MPVLSRSRSLQLRPGTSGSVPFIAIAATVVACFLVATHLEAPSTIPHLTIVNTQDWAAEVAVAEAPAGAGVPVGTVERGATRTFTDVLDHGGTWVLRYSYRGVVEEQVTDASGPRRPGVEGAGARQLRARLQEAGLPPTPGP